MTTPAWKPVWYRQIRWKLSLSYSLVLFIAIVVAQVLFLISAVVYFYYQDPDLTPIRAFVRQMLPLLKDDLLAIPLFLLLGHAFSRRFGLRLERLVYAVNAWAEGKFYVRPRDDSQDEIGMLTRRLLVMADQLQKNVETEQNLAAARERNRIARDLHDTVKQQVFAIQMELNAVRNLLVSDSGAATKMLDEAIDHTRNVQRDLNSMIDRVPPAGLGHKTLGTALRDYIDQVDMFGVDVTFRVTGDRDLPIELEEALFRIAQGALSNVAKHSRAISATIDIEHGVDHVSLRVADDGIGFDAYEPRMNAFGLESMRTRMAEIGGTLTISSQPGAGTILTAVAPSLPTQGADKE